MGWWTDLAEVRGPVINSGDGDGRPGELADRAVECRGLILHIADGYYEGTISWQHNPDADVSSQFVVAGPRDVAKGIPDGKIAQCVDTDERAWTQRDGNGHWLSVECSGFSGDALSAAQIESCARILARGHQIYGYPLQLATSPSGRGLGHHSMGAESGVNWGHSNCPGPKIKAQKPLILARAIAIANGEGMFTAQEERDIVFTLLKADGQAMHYRVAVLRDLVAQMAKDVAGLKSRPAATLTAEDRAAIAAAVLVGLESQIRAIVRSELDQTALTKLAD